MSNLSGLALSIRRAVDSETFDLAGKNASTIETAIKSAFQDDFPLDETIRITFVTGAGKLARQKYDENAAKAITNNLRDLGYQEDHGGGAGTFKLQHDTGKNLKTVVVYPKVEGNLANDDDHDNEAYGGGDDAVPSLLPEGSPEQKIAMSSMPTFERMLRSQCASWSQKKGCTAALEELQSQVDELDIKLVKGMVLDPSEQDFYDNVTSLDEKLALVKDEMHKQVEDRGDITKPEQAYLLQHNSERLATLEKEIQSAGPQKQKKLKAMQEKALHRKELLSNIDAKPPRKLKHEQALARLWKEVVPMLQVEENARRGGRLLTVKETQAVARKDEILEEISDLEEASRGWFEDEATFDARVKEIRSKFTAKLKTAQQLHKGPSASGTSGGARKPNMAMAFPTAGAANTGSDKKWVTPVERNNKKNAWGTNNKKKKNKGNKAGGLFAAMMASDDDASDDSSDAAEELSNDGGDTVDLDTPVEKQADLTVESTSPSAPQNDDTDAAPVGKKKKKGGNKKKNKKGKSKNNSNNNRDLSEDEVLDATVAANAAAAKAKEEEQKAQEGEIMSHPVVSFVRNYVIPLILALITWIATLIMGKPKQKKR